ncbi:MAG: AAA family ATPase [Phycisphaeraceae bacterium]|nr:AAA family ATPase [Phycisphaeraceae bacterium]MCB9848098.1 AAA family ATPase [Phycisphaeraceae bacterium]
MSDNAVRATDTERLTGLIASRHPLVLIPTHEEGYALECVRSAALELGAGLLVWDAVSGLGEGLIAGEAAADLTENAAAAMYYAATAVLGKHREGEAEAPPIVCFLDLCAHLNDPKALRALRNLVRTASERGGCVALIDHADQAPAVVRSHAATLELSLPDEEELRGIVRRTARRLHTERPIAVTISERDLHAIVGNLRGLNRRQAERVIEDVIRDDRMLSAADIDRVIARKREHLESDGVLEFVSAPGALDEIGGMDRLKRWLAARSGSLGPDAAGAGLTPPRGVLLLGVQGAGKSLCAKAVATAWKRPLMRMDVGAMYDRFVGESERRLRATLLQAEMMAPMILWIDEIEKAFAGAASQSVDGGLSRRMFGALLTWMQEHRSPVFVVATANDIGALPPELLRKGRFDEIFFVDLPSEASRARIFGIHLRKQGLDEAAFDLGALASASAGFSGSEIEQAIIAARHEAFHEKAGVTTGRLVTAIQGSPPLSVTMTEQITALRAWAATRCVPAGD